MVLDLGELVDALFAYDALRARQWVADATRTGIRFAEFSRPDPMTAEQLAVAAGVLELLAERADEDPPAWTRDIKESPRRIFLVRAAASMPRLRRLCEQEGPMPLRRRQLYAPPGFLSVA